MPTPECPRCGYDQSGETARWSEQCPLEGLCSECGLAFEWANAFNPDRERLKGFFEHTRGLVRSFLAAWWTWWWALLPWRFWKRVRLEHRIHARRLGLWPIVIAMCFKTVALGATWLGTYIATLNFRTLYKRPLPHQWQSYVGAILEPVADLQFLGAGGGVSGIVLSPARNFLPMCALPILFAMLAFPVALIVLPHTRARAKVRPGHVVRAWVYSLAPLALLGLVYAVRTIIEWYEIATNTGQRFRGSVLWYFQSASWSIEVAVAIIVCTIGWLFVWWYCALRMGFRMERIAWPMIAMGAVVLLSAFLGVLMDNRLGVELVT